MIKIQSFSALINSTSKFSRISSNFLKAFSTLIEDVAPVKTVDLSYKTYETEESKQKNLTPLIILHGMMCSKNNWTMFCEAINQHTERKVIAIDARNHGDSPRAEDMTYKHLVEDVLVLLKKLNITKTAILGHSMGGRTAMVLALQKVQISDLFFSFDI